MDRRHEVVVDVDATRLGWRRRGGTGKGGRGGAGEEASPAQRRRGKTPIAVQPRSEKGTIRPCASSAQLNWRRVGTPCYSVKHRVRLCASTKSTQARPERVFQAFEPEFA
jgi:hypothetical protein